MSISPKKFINGLEGELSQRVSIYKVKDYPSIKFIYIFRNKLLSGFLKLCIIIIVHRLNSFHDARTKLVIPVWLEN